MNHQDWERSVPEAIRGDSLWKMEVYRLGLFIADVAWRDVSKLVADRRTIGLSDQLYRAVGSVSANLEGYSRSSSRDRAGFYEYALGSAREGRGWYFKARHVLGLDVAEHRLHLLTQVIRLLLTMVSDQRGDQLHEETVPFRTAEMDTQTLDLNGLLQDVPLP